MIAVTKNKNLDLSFSNDSFLLNNDDDEEIKNLFDSIDLF